MPRTERGYPVARRETISLASVCMSRRGRDRRGDRHCLSRGRDLRGRSRHRHGLRCRWGRGHSYGGGLSHRRRGEPGSGRCDGREGRCSLGHNLGCGLVSNYGYCGGWTRGPLPDDCEGECRG